MKKHIPFLIVLAMIAIGIISSCKKDPSPTDGIVFGQTNGMIVTTYDSIMEYYDASRPLVLDLNGDGANAYGTY